MHLTENLTRKATGGLKKEYDNARNFSMEYLKEHDEDVYNYVNKINNIPRKIAFVHFGKCAGIYTQVYLRKHIVPDYTILNSWWDHKKVNERRLTRDWTEKELIEIANATEHDKIFTHNHHINWSLEAIKEFKKNNWFTFTFLRDPREIICSLYFWAKKQANRKDIPEEARNPLEDEITKISGQADPSRVSLDEFFRFIVTDKEAKKLWVLPDYTKELDWVAEFNEENLKIFFDKHFCHEYSPKEKANTSENKGYKYYCQNELITKEAQNLIETSPEFMEYDKWLSN